MNLEEGAGNLNFDFFFVGYLWGANKKVDCGK